MKHLKKFENTDFDYRFDNPHSEDIHVVKMKIKELEKALKLLGGSNMQKIYVSTTERGMDAALGTGSYIDLSEEPFVFAGIKKSLQDMLDVQKEILEKN